MDSVGRWPTVSRILAVSLVVGAVAVALPRSGEAAWSKFNVCVHSKGTCVTSVNCWRSSTTVHCGFRGSQQGVRRACKATVTFPSGSVIQTGKFWTVVGKWSYAVAAKNQYWARGQFLKPKYINLTCD